MNNEDLLENLRSTLGRSTLRGVRRCPKCGTFNGVRGSSCKNKACDVVFKESGSKRKQSMEVCKLLTGTSTQVFSVRVRDKGPDYRGFVQIPIVQSNESYLTNISALCFVDSCQKIFNSSILKCHEQDDEIEMTTVQHPIISCQHIQSALKCSTDAQPLTIKNDVLSSLNLTEQTKQEIWDLGSETPGPLIQRVSKTIMVVKCKLSTKTPLGYLHVTFFLRPKDPHSTCTCKSRFTNGSVTVKTKNCIHYYACIAAFASDPKLEEEFSQFIEKERLPITPLASLECILGEQSIDKIDSSKQFMRRNIDFNQELQAYRSILEDLQATESLSPDLPSAVITAKESQSYKGILEDLQSSEGISVDNSPTITTIKVKKIKKRNLGETSCLQKNKSVKKGPQKKHFRLSNEKVDESTVQLGFIEWLSSVTERINQLMHFQMDGKPPPLVFFTPHVFFDCLMERVITPCIGVGRRRRLPNKVSTIRRTTPPLGLFHSYTWNISNILHAKAIFDTPLIVLNVTKSFMRNIDGSYKERSLRDEATPTPLLNYQRRPGEASIRPAELKTYLKIGKTSPDQTVPGLLSIDWTPDILPTSKMGLLEIRFEFGHTPSLH